MKNGYQRARAQEEAKVKDTYHGCMGTVLVQTGDGGRTCDITVRFGDGWGGKKKKRKKEEGEKKEKEK